MNTFEARLYQVRFSIDSGIPVYIACQTAGISLGQWYYHQRGLKVKKPPEPPQPARVIGNEVWLYKGRIAECDSRKQALRVARALNLFESQRKPGGQHAKDKTTQIKKD